MRVSLPVAVLLVVAAGCSSRSDSAAPKKASTPEAGAPPVDAATTMGPVPPPGAVWTTADYQMHDTVAAGSEDFRCQFINLPDVAGWMVLAEHTFTPGSHHLLVYTTSLTSIPPGGDQPQECYPTSGTSPLTHNTGVLYGGQQPTGSEAFPPAIGRPTTASQIVLFEVHFLNATSAPLDGNADLKITIDSGTDITVNAGGLFLYDPYIYVPVGAMAQAQMRCLIPNDVTVITAQSHDHARGINYQAYVDPSPMQLATQPFYTSDSWSSPTLATMKMPVAGGSRIRFQCDYDNTSGTMAYYQGPSAIDNEMCIFMGTYYPDLGSSVDNCSLGPDMYGTGTASCAATLDCMSGCANALALDSGPAATPCAQTCMVESCPMSFETFGPLFGCIRTKCASACGSLGSADCKACITSSCAPESAACGTTCP